MQNRIGALAIVLVGCGGGGNGGTHFSTNVSGGTPVASLTPSQQAQVCGDAQGYVKSLLGDVCKIEGFIAAATLSLSNTAATNADLQAACSATSADCAHSDAGVGQCDFSSFQSATCTATVSQLSACLNDIGAMEDRNAAMFPSCSSVTTQNVTTALDQDAGASPEPPSCVAFDNACPGQTVTGTMGAKM